MSWRKESSTSREKEAPVPAVLVLPPPPSGSERKHEEWRLVVLAALPGLPGLPGPLHRSNPIYLLPGPRSLGLITANPSHHPPSPSSDPLLSLPGTKSPYGRAPRPSRQKIKTRPPVRMSPCPTPRTPVKEAAVSEQHHNGEWELGTSMPGDMVVLHEAGPVDEGEARRYVVCTTQHSHPSSWRPG